MDLADSARMGEAFARVEAQAGGVVIHAGPRTDAFAPPDGGAAVDRLGGLRIALPEGAWRVWARVRPNFGAMFDAGAMMLRSEAGAWAKLAYEQSPGGQALAVSVVTRGVSDDCNGPAFAGPDLWLRACSTGVVCAFHTSLDGKHWDLLRLFALPGRVVTLDLIAQSPVGEGCSVQFADVGLSHDAPKDMRDGS
jgi:regulation of enolase protein 1 (concanavalin A-like superfamily)